MNTNTDWQQEFLAKFDMPMPSKSLEERHRQRTAFRNERSIYRGTCDLTGKGMISMYSEDKPFTVYSPEAWWGDDWDPLD